VIFIQDDSQSMLTPIFSLNNEFIILILIFGILEIFVLFKECPVAIQTSVFQMKPPLFNCKLFIVDNFKKKIDVPN